MSDQSQSRFTPQNPNWHADLPERDAPDIEQPAIYSDLNYIDDTYLEYSRASVRSRGMLVLFSIPLFLQAVFLVWMFGGELIKEFDWFSVFMPIAALGSIAFGIFGLRLDLATPRDEPVRFNRKRGKVYVSEYKHTWNPFGHWGAVTKEYDWNTLQAEITREAGFNGKIYVVRYALILVSVKPGTNEVVDRFRLAMPFDNYFPPLWAYLKHYMRGGPIVKPETALRRQEASFINSMYEWLPTFEITQTTGYNGEIIKHSFGASVAILFGNLLLSALFPLLFIMAVSHYIAMRFAPESIWPPEMDEASKTAPT